MAAAHQSHTPYEWIGRLPDGWTMQTNAALFDERIERGADLPLLSVTMGQGVILQTEQLQKKDSSKEDKSQYKTARRGDLVYNKMRMWQGAVGVSDHDGVVSPAYIVLKPRSQINPRYFHYLYRLPQYAGESYRRSYGICDDQLSLRYFDFRRMRSIVPPTAIQDSIVAFLDQKEREIAEYITTKRRMIEVLSSAFQARVDAVFDDETRDTVRLGHLADIVTGFPFDSSKYTTSENGVRLLRGINVGVGRARWDEVARWPVDQQSKLGRYLLREGDLVIGMDRPWIEEGLRAAILSSDDVPSLLLQRVAVLRPRNTSEARFLCYALRSKRFRRHVEPDTTGVSVPHISPDQITGFRIPETGGGTQSGIADDLAQYEKDILTTITLVSCEIAVMQEYRTALIADVVTGRKTLRAADRSAP